MNKDHKTPGGVQIGVTEDNVTRITAVFHKCRVAVESYFASRLRCSTAEAKELAQETYTALIRRRKRREVEDWEGLLWCSARNRAMNNLRQRRFRQEQDVLMFLDLETEDHRTPETWLTQEQTSAAIERAIALLPKQWQYVVSCVRKGQSYEQIAKQLAVNERTCRRYMKRAIRKIQQQIGMDDIHEQR